MQTAAAWYDEGIPRDASLADYFDFDIEMMFVDASPRFEMKVLERRDGNITYEDRYGYTITKQEGLSSTMHFVRHVTTDQDAWTAIKERFRLSDDPREPSRVDDVQYFGHFDPYPTWSEAVAKYERLRATDRYILFMVYGPMEATWRHRGMENLLMDLALEPDWVSEMAGTFQDLVIATLRRCAELGMKPDGILAADDLGSSTGPMLSPQMWRSIFKPHVARLGEFLRSEDIAFWMHTDGQVEPLLDDIIDAGVQVLNPLEVKAGMDGVALRERYGRELAFYGNIDATKMAGGRDALLAELERKVPLAWDGGYIFHSDHSCPPDVSLERYQWILDKARRIFDDGP